MPNRLADSTSPYLRQHADNPVAWEPWDALSLGRAAAENKPIFLSVGYSSCHWCHVMAHESFEDDQVAASLNSSFVSIKLDREERPDVDEIYMTACQMATGHGGWPLTVFLTPDLKPFFVGTYFPRESRGDFPGFLTIVNNLASAWRDNRAEIETAANEFAAAIQDTTARSRASYPTTPSYVLLDHSIEAFHGSFDYEEGGFGSAPKFPPHTALRFFLNYASRRDPGEDQAVREYSSQAGYMALLTLEKMALSGLHDHVGGGFHRYSTDHLWHLPHFEKMLYDNAQLLWTYSFAAELSEDESLRRLFRLTADGIAGWVEREMTAEDGLFYTALDADSDGEEGLYYTWTEDEIREALGDEADLVLRAFQCLPEGNFLEEGGGDVTGRNILHLAEKADFSGILPRLASFRASRVRPGLDDKALAGPNGLMIAGLARAGFVQPAIRCAEVWLAHEELPHQITRGVASGPAFLDDYAFLADGLVELYMATTDARWLSAARDIANRMVEVFGDKAPGYWFSGVSSDLLARTKPALDNATPSPNGVALRVLLAVGMREEFERSFSSLLGWAAKMPQAAETLLDVLRAYLEVETEPVVVESDIAVGAVLTPRRVVAGADGWGHAMVTLSLPAGVHINTHEPPETWLVPTTLRLEGVLGEAGFPESSNDRYEGEVNIPIRIRVPVAEAAFRLVIRYQACTEQACMAPQEVVLEGAIIPAGV
jgi:uncharacterized protein YyaL (SSP411 family)